MPWNFINQVERWTEATFVGEPSGSKPNFAGEDTELLLPYSGLRGSISTRWWQDSGPLDRRQWIAPHQSVGVRSTDYFANRDPVLEAVLDALDRPAGRNPLGALPNKALAVVGRTELCAGRGAGYDRSRERAAPGAWDAALAGAQLR